MSNQNGKWNKYWVQLITVSGVLEGVFRGITLAPHAPLRLRSVMNLPHAPFKWAAKDNDKRSANVRKVQETWDELMEDSVMIGRLVSTDPSSWLAEYAGTP